MIKQAIKTIIALLVLLISSTEAWAGLQLKSNLGAKATVTFYDYGTTEPTTSSFTKPSTAITQIDNSDGKDHYIIVHIVPKDGYWTDQQLLFVTETGAMLAPRRAPGLDLGQLLKFLKADEYDATGYGGMKDRYDGAGWYYYKLSKEHTTTAGYTSSTVDGYVVPQFDLSTGVLSSTEASTSATTLTINTTDGWQAVITIDKTSYPYNGELQNSKFNHNIVVKKDGTTALEIPKTRHGKHIEYSIMTEPIPVKGVIDAGDYTAQISALKHSFFKGEKGGVPFKITPKELTASVTVQSKTYDGTTDATVTGTVDTGITSYNVETLTISGLTGTFDDANVGTDKTVTIDASAVSVVAGANTKTSNYNITYPTTAKANITAKNIDIPDDPTDPAYNDIKVNVPTGGYTYDGTEKKPTVTVKDGSTVLTLDKDYTVSYTNNKDAGDNTAVVTITGKGNYTIDETRQFSIAKKELTASVKVTAKVYDGTTTATVSATVETGVTDETLTISGLTGTFDDANVGTDKTVTINSSAAVVTAGETGTKTSNYIITIPTSAKGNITLKEIISPDDPNDPNYGAITVNVPTGGYTYDGTEKKPTVTVMDGSTVLTIDKDYTVNYTNNKDAGDNTAVVTITGIGRYTINTTRHFSIAKKTVTITALDKTFTYTGEAQSWPYYDVGGLIGSDDINAVVTGSITYFNESPVANVVSSYTFKTGTPGNYSVTTQDGTLTIEPLTGVVVTITGHNGAVTYDGEEHSVSGYDVKISNPLYKETDFTFSGTAEAKRTEAGKTMMGLAVDQFANNNANFASVTFNVTDGYQEISPITAIVTITGHHDVVTYDGEEHSVSGYDVTFSNNLYKESDFTFSGKSEAKRTEVGKTYMGLATDQFTNNNTNFSSVTFNVTDGYQEISSVDEVIVKIGRAHV